MMYRGLFELIIFIIIIAIVVWCIWIGLKSPTIDKVSYQIPYNRLCEPRTIEELLLTLRHNTRPICIVGSDYSQGGQTFRDKSIRISLKYINQVQFTDSSQTSILVQSGATWKRVIQFLDRYNKSVAEMQSYWNFSVGGSISVNCHGRGMRYGTVADTILCMEVLTVNDLKIHRVYPRDELFNAVVGGYGAIAIILSATLIVEDNIAIRRYVISSTVEDFNEDLDHIERMNPIMYNAEIYPGEYDNIHHIYWLPDTAPANTARLRTQDAVTRATTVLGAQLVKSCWLTRPVRSQYERRKADQPTSVWKNYEMSLDVDTLKPLTQEFTTYVLQEYFIPSPSITLFISRMVSILNAYRVNILHISLRYVRPSRIGILKYASASPMIAVVLYINVWNTDRVMRKLKEWTRKLIDSCLQMRGRYYLPYLPLATRKQFESAYPEIETFRDMKWKYDPYNMLRSEFIDRYIMSYGCQNSRLSRLK